MRQTIYRIIKRTNKKLIVNRDKTDVEISHWYIAKRKGRIFGFWHVVGHEADWWSGDIYSHTTDTLKSMEEYLASYNEVYNNDKPYKIIYPPKE